MFHQLILRLQLLYGKKIRLKKFCLQNSFDVIDSKNINESYLSQKWLQFSNKVKAIFDETSDSYRIYLIFINRVDCYVFSNVFNFHYISAREKLRNTCFDEKTFLNSFCEKNIYKAIFVQLSINYNTNNLDQLRDLVVANINVLMISKPNLDNSYPDDNFPIKGYDISFLLDRNKH